MKLVVTHRVIDYYYSLIKPDIYMSVNSCVDPKGVNICKCINLSFSRSNNLSIVNRNLERSEILTAGSLREDTWYRKLPDNGRRTSLYMLY